MKFIAPNLFDFAKNSTLKSEFKGTKRIAKDLGIHFDDAAMQSLNPQIIFEQLIKGKINLELIQVFTLMGWENHQWTSKNGKTAMRNWWLSALDKEQQGEPIFRHVMVLRTILADNERYPAPKDVIQTMRMGLEDLIASGEWKYSNNLDVLKALITQNAKKLAEIAFKQNISIIQLMQNCGFPKKLPIVNQAEEKWIEVWIEAKPIERQNNVKTLKKILSETLSFERQIDFTSVIFSTNALPKNIDKLKQTVKNYPEITEWLAFCARNLDFRYFFEQDDAKRLICWIGTGTYEKFKRLISDMANREISSDESSWENRRKATRSRYLFWVNYQNSIQEAWLLIPKNIWHKYEDLENIKNIIQVDHYLYPTLIIHIGNFYFLQKLIASKFEVDLLMTQNRNEINELLKNELIDGSHLDQVDFCFIHDFGNLWQSDCAYTLEKDFNILPDEQKIVYDEHGSFNVYKHKVLDDNFIKDRTSEIKYWLRNAKHRWTNQQLQKTALTAQRYNLL